MLLLIFLNRTAHDNAWAAGLLIVLLIICAVVILVRRDRRERDLDRRALTRAVARLTDHNRVDNQCNTFK